jgi:hypothetical protein
MFCTFYFTLEIQIKEWIYQCLLESMIKDEIDKGFARSGHGIAVES